MAVSPIPQAPLRQDRRVYPTPLIGDVVFSEVRDCSRISIPEYGTPHPNPVKWPHHELVYVKPVDIERDGLFEFFYAADRENQDLYNFQFSQADIGGVKFDSVVRTYVTLRASFTPDALEMGATMPDTPASIFTETFVLAERRQTRLDEPELDSLYVAETRVYVKRATIIDNGFNDVLGANLSRTTTIHYRGEIVNGAAVETLVADDKNAYWGTQVAEKVARSGQQLSDNWFAVIEQQLTLKRDTSGALIDDWPIGQVKSKGREILTPQKFRISTEVVETTTPLDLAAVNVDDLPEPNAPTGDEVEVRVTKINDYRYEQKVRTETVDENTDPLVGESYGKIVTTESLEILVEEGDEADTGILIISSDVVPLGDGKAVKTTQKVKGDSWPDPLSREITNEGPGLPPQRYRKDIKLTKTSKKIAASAIPDNPTLSGSEIAKQYVKETPDRAEETVTTQELNLNISGVDTAVERRPFVHITSTMTPANEPVLPATGNGNARLVYENGTDQIYENTQEVATAVSGFSGTQNDSRVGYKLETSKNYSTDSTVSSNLGSSQVVFNDGVIQVYEVSEVVATPVDVSFVGGKMTTPLLEETTTTEYKTSPEGDGIYNSRVAFTDGDITVYEVNSTEVTPLEARTYLTIIQARVPAVLQAIEFKTWMRRDGGSRTAVNTTIEEGYEGSFQGRVTEYFTKDPNVANGFEPLVMRPKSIAYTGWNFSISIPATLHGPQAFFESTGTNNPEWEFSTYDYYVAATTPASIPTGFVPYALDVQPFKDGYIVREIEIKYKN